MELGNQIDNLPVAFLFPDNTSPNISKQGSEYSQAAREATFSGSFCNS